MNYFISIYMPFHLFPQDCTFVLHLSFKQVVVVLVNIKYKNSLKEGLGWKTFKRQRSSSARNQQYFNANLNLIGN